MIVMSANLRGINVEVEQAARSLGANRITTLRRVVFPLALPGMIASGLFAFLISFDELIIALFNQQPTSSTLPKKLWDGLRTEINPTIAAVSTLLVLLISGIISSPLSMIFNRFGVLVGMIHFMLPYMILTLYSVMAGIPKELTQAAASLGAPPYKQFLRIYLPLSMPGIGAGCLLVFILAVAFFVTPALLGGLKDTMISQVIQSEIDDALNWGFGAALSMLLMIVTTTLYLIYNRVMGVERIHGG